MTICQRLHSFIWLFTNLSGFIGLDFILFFFRVGVYKPLVERLWVISHPATAKQFKRTAFLTKLKKLQPKQKHEDLCGTFPVTNKVKNDFKKYFENIFKPKQ